MFGHEVSHKSCSRTVFYYVTLRRWGTSETTQRNIPNDSHCTAPRSVICELLKINQFVLNTNKTYNVKFLSYKALICPLHLIWSDQTLFVTDTIKFLGLHLDSHLSWKSHTNILVKKFSSVCYVMRKLSCILNIDTLSIVYFAHFQSLINCGIIFCVSSQTMQNVFLIQKRIITIMLGLGPRSSCRGEFKKLDILTVPCLYIFALMMFVC
jgi:hypothetical protein